VDLTDGEAWDAWLSQAPSFDVVIHLAAEIPRPGRIEDSELLLLRNLESTRKALKAVSTGRGVFVYASSAFVYDPAGQRPAVESDCVAPTSFYHLSKTAGEALVSVATTRLDARAVSLRVSAPYGWGQEPATVLWRFLYAARQSRDITLFGSGERRQDFVHVDDVVTAVECVIDRPVAGTFNIASGSSVTMRRLAELARAVTPGSTSSVRATGDADPQEGVHWRFSIEKARTELGYTPRVSLKEGLTDLAARLAEATAG
jgi:nucleoside-diphosphate-sugar epimerase